MEKYSGLCITGPLDGKILEIDRPFYMAAETESFYGLPFMMSQAMLPSSVPMGKVIEYKYNRLPGDVGIFAPNELGLPGLLKHLVKNYRPKVGEENDKHR